MRRGLGKGKGKGWKNLQTYDPVRHSLSARGIKTVSLPQRRKRAVARQMLPLLKERVISGYNISDRPIGRHSHVILIYGHDAIAHGDALIRLFDGMNVKYTMMPRESAFIDDDTFIKTKGQVRVGDIVQAKEYEIWFDGSPRILGLIERQMRTKAVNRGKEHLPDSYTTPDIRLKNALRYRNFRVADEIRKPLDKDTDLVILSVHKPNTALLRRRLTGEKVSKILLQDYQPRKHSLHAYIEDKTN